MLIFVPFFPKKRGPMPKHQPSCTSLSVLSDYISSMHSPPILTSLPRYRCRCIISSFVSPISRYTKILLVKLFESQSGYLKALQAVRYLSRSSVVRHPAVLACNEHLPVGQRVALDVVYFSITIWYTFLLLFTSNALEYYLRLAWLLFRLARLLDRKSVV